MNSENLIKFLINWFQYSPDDAIDEVEERPNGSLEMAKMMVEKLEKDKGISQETKDKIRQDFQSVLDK